MRQLGRGRTVPVRFFRTVKKKKGVCSSDPHRESRQARNRGIMAFAPLGGWLRNVPMGNAPSGSRWTGAKFSATPKAPPPLHPGLFPGGGGTHQTATPLRPWAARSRPCSFIPFREKMITADLEAQRNRPVHDGRSRPAELIAPPPEEAIFG